MDGLKISQEEAAELAQLLAYAVSVGDEETRVRAGRWIGVFVAYGGQPSAPAS